MTAIYSCIIYIINYIVKISFKFWGTWIFNYYVCVICK